MKLVGGCEGWPDIPPYATKLLEDASKMVQKDGSRGHVLEQLYESIATYAACTSISGDIWTVTKVNWRAMKKAF